MKSSVALVSQKSKSAESFVGHRYDSSSSVLEDIFARRFSGFIFSVFRFSSLEGIESVPNEIAFSVDSSDGSAPSCSRVRLASCFYRARVNFAAGLNAGTASGSVANMAAGSGADFCETPTFRVDKRLVRCRRNGRKSENE